MAGRSRSVSTLQIRWPIYYNTEESTLDRQTPRIRPEVPEVPKDEQTIHIESTRLVRLGERELVRSLSGNLHIILRVCRRLLNFFNFLT